MKKTILNLKYKFSNSLLFNEMPFCRKMISLLFSFRSRAIFFIPEWIIFAPLINPCPYKFEYF